MALHLGQEGGKVALKEGQVGGTHVDVLVVRREAVFVRHCPVIPLAKRACGRPAGALIRLRRLELCCGLAIELSSRSRDKPTSDQVLISDGQKGRNGRPTPAHLKVAGVAYLHV